MSTNTSAVAIRGFRLATMSRGPPPKTVAIHLDEFGRSAADGITTLALPPCEYNLHVPPAIERDHVHAVYDTIADHWSATRYRAWPKVEEFLKSLPQNSLVGDLGMGNGKNVNAGLRLGNLGWMMGADISRNLVHGCNDKLWRLSYLKLTFVERISERQMFWRACSRGLLGAAGNARVVQHE